MIEGDVMYVSICSVFIFHHLCTDLFEIFFIFIQNIFVLYLFYARTAADAVFDTALGSSNFRWCWWPSLCLCDEERSSRQNKSTRVVLWPVQHHAPLYSAGAGSVQSQALRIATQNLASKSPKSQLISTLKAPWQKNTLISSKHLPLQYLLWSLVVVMLCPWAGYCTMPLHRPMRGRVPGPGVERGPLVTGAGAGAYCDFKGEYTPAQPVTQSQHSHLDPGHCSSFSPRGAHSRAPNKGTRRFHNNGECPY